MPAPDLSFTVYGTPIGQGAMSSFGPGRMVHTNAKRLKPWRKQIAKAATAAAEQTGWVGEERPVQVAVEFLFARPATHYRTGRNAHLLRENAPTHPTGMQYGDIDHLVRAVLDALTSSGVIPDDKYVTTVYAGKTFAHGEPFAVVRLSRE